MAADTVAALTCLQETSEAKETAMLYTVAIVMIVLWALGLITSTTMGGFIHVLLVIAAVIVLAGFITGRRRI